MQKLITILTVVSLLTLSNTKFAFARFWGTDPVETTKERYQEKKEEIQEKVQERKDNFQEKKASREAETIENRNTRISSFWANAKSRILVAIQRLNNIISRIEVRIAKVDAEGKRNTSEAKANVQKAKNLIADANKKVLEVDTNLATMLSSQNPKDSLKSVISDIKTIRKDLFEANKSLTFILGNLKGWKLTLTPTLTVTPTPEN